MSANIEKLIEEARRRLWAHYHEAWSEEHANAVLRSLVASVQRDRDIEWCAMLGYEPAGGKGNTPEFMKRELEVNEQDSWASVRRQALEDAVRVAESYRWTSSRWMPPEPQPGSQAIADAIRSLLSESTEGTKG